MDILKYKEYEGTAELDMARGVCRGKLLFIDDLVTYASQTTQGLQQEFEAAVEDYIATCAEFGKEPRRPFRGLISSREACARCSYATCESGDGRYRVVLGFATLAEAQSAHYWVAHLLLHDVERGAHQASTDRLRRRAASVVT